MEIALLFKIAGVGILVAVLCQVLGKAGRDEQALYVTVGGILIVITMLLGQIGTLLESVKTLFGL